MMRLLLLISISYFVQPSEGQIYFIFLGFFLRLIIILGEDNCLFPSINKFIGSGNMWLCLTNYNNWNEILISHIEPCLIML